jgi:hypothetical protein
VRRARAEIAKWIVPHVANRPLTIVHCPRLIESYWIVPRVRLRNATLIRQYAEWMISLCEEWATIIYQTALRFTSFLAGVMGLISRDSRSAIRSMDYARKICMDRAPIKTFWRLGELTCALFTGDGTFELRLLHGKHTLRSEVCTDSGEAYTKSKEWHRIALRRTPSGR